MGSAPLRRAWPRSPGCRVRCCGAFSRRRGQIEAELERRGSAGAAVAQVAALETRRRKDGWVTPQELVPEWQHRAARLGLDARAIAGLAGKGAARPVGPAVCERAFGELAGPGGLTRRQPDFTRRDVLQALCEALPPRSELTDGELERLADRFLGSDRVVSLAVSDKWLGAGRVIRRRDRRLVPAARPSSTRSI